MNIAEQIIDWLYTDQLAVGDQWSYLLPTGFTWWADQFSQTIEILGEEIGPSGEIGYLVCVRTELLRELDITDETLAPINALPMRCAALSGPVYDPAARMLDLWSLVRVTDDNGDWIRFLLAAAAVTQAAEARLLAPVLADAAGAQPATSAHPEAGPRTTPAHLASSAAAMFASAGDEPCAWTPAEFDNAVTEWNLLPHSAAHLEDHGASVEFPFGDQVSLCRLIGDQQHPLYGNGLLVLQRFPVDIPDAEGIAVALSLNAADLTGELAGYGLGSYSYADGAVHFSGFVPNALHKPGLLTKLYSSCSARAQRMAARFVDGGWDADAYSLDAAVLERRRQERQSAMPVPERPIRGCPMMHAKAGGN